MMPRQPFRLGRASQGFGGQRWAAAAHRLASWALRCSDALFYLGRQSKRLGVGKAFKGDPSIFCFLEGFSSSAVSRCLVCLGPMLLDSRFQGDDSLEKGLERAKRMENTPRKADIEAKSADFRGVESEECHRHLAELGGIHVLVAQLDLGDRMSL